jgi:hypothetical protein
MPPLAVTGIASRNMRKDRWKIFQDNDVKFLHTEFSDLKLEDCLEFLVTSTYECMT